MRLAFVIRLGNDTRPADRRFEGWVQEVDTCCEVRFRSTEELLNFLGERFNQLTVSNGEVRPDEADPGPRGRWAGKSKRGSRGKP
jgi:hypothetical protein